MAATEPVGPNGEKFVDPFDDPDFHPRAATAPEPEIVGPNGETFQDPFDNPNFQPNRIDWDAASAPGSHGAMPASTGPAPTTPGEFYAQNIPKDSPDPTGFLGGARSAVLEDPGTKIAALAARRFPNMPPEQAARRYGVVNGDIVYRGDDGNTYKEFSGIGGLLGNITGEHGLPMAGATVGAGMTGGSPAGAGLGGIIGLAIRKLTALGMGDQQDPVGNAADFAIEGALGWGAGRVGRAVGNVANRRMVRDVARLDLNEARRLEQIARSHGLTLTPAEMTRLGSLINQERYLGTRFDAAGDTMRQFYGDRAEDVARVVDDFIGRPPHVETVGAKARGVATQSIDDAMSARSTATRSTYRMLDKANPELPAKALEGIEADDAIREAIDTIVSNPKYGMMDMPRGSFRVLDGAQKLLRENAGKEGVQSPGKSYTEGVLEGARGRLTRAMESSFGQGYRDARAAHAALTEPVDDLTRGLEGVISRVKDTSLAGIPDKLLSGKNTNPAMVARWRRQFVSQGREGDWDELVSAWMRREWESIKPFKTVGDKVGAQWRSRIFGTPNQQKIMREALGPDRYQAMNDLMDVFKAIDDMPRGGSQTQPAGEFAKDMANQVAPIASKAGLGSLRDWWVGMKMGNWTETLAKVATSPDALAQLKKLRVLSPRSEKALQVTTMALTRAGVFEPARQTVESVADPTPESFPPRLPAR